MSAARTMAACSLLGLSVVLVASSTNASGPGSDRTDAAGTPKNMAKGLLVAQAQFTKVDGKTRPGAARLEIVTRKNGKWITTVLEDDDSNVFHKAFVLDPKGGKPGVVTLGASKAAVKIWRKKGGKLRADTLWQTSFGGKWDRMRDAEIVKTKGGPGLAVATHDQGVVALLLPKGNKFTVKELDRKKSTFVHEIEVGDVDGDGNIEIYATPSEPNKLKADVQKGEVVRYEAPNWKRRVVADLGNRHAKEILVTDMDGDGRDELYVAVEAKTRRENKKTIIEEGVEIRRYEKGSSPTSRDVVATFDDRFTRFLTAGDTNGDGKQEMVAACFRAGLWHLTPTKKGKWRAKLIDKKSSGFEHAAILTDLDGDDKDELYVASDVQGELRRYTPSGGGWDKEVISRRDNPRGRLTWNLMPVPVSLVP